MARTVVITKQGVPGSAATGYSPGGTDVAVTDGGTGASSAAAARTNLGLGNVDNTSDANKPVSTAQGAADALALARKPEEVRAGIPVPIGDVAAWAYYTTGTGTVTAGSDAVAGNYIRLSTTAQAAIRRGRDLPFRLDGGRFISFLLRRNDANLSVFDLFAGLGSYGVSPASRWNKGASTLDTGAWRRYIVHPDEQNRVGTITNFNDLRSLSIQITPTAATDTSVDIADIRIHPPSARGSAGAVAFIFDDGRLDTYQEAFPRLEAYGWKAGTAVEHTNVGTAGRASVAQLQELYTAGWDIYGHHTAQMTSISDAAQVTVHQESKAFLQTNGFVRGSDIWVWPGGARSAATEAIAFRYWRTMRRVASFVQMGAAHIYDPVDPPISFYATALKPLSQATAVIDRVIAGGGLAVVVMHGLVASGATAESWLISEFEGLLSYIDAAGLDVLPVSEFWTA